MLITAALLNHLPRGGLQREQQSFNVDRKNPIEDLWTDLQEWAYADNACIVNQDVNGTRTLDHAAHHCVDRFLPPNGFSISD
jgi:hypothetical protein